MGHNMKTLLTTLCILLLPLSAYATPAITEVSGGSLSHGETGIVITSTSTNFGTKSPAAPLVWDDCEGTYLLKSQGGLWDQVQPSALTGDEASYNMAFRTSPFSRSGNSILAPHGRSTKFIGGGHYDRCTAGEARGDTVGYAVTVRLNESSENWYITYYARADPLFPNSGGSNLNHKTTFYSEDPVATNDDWCYETYVSYSGTGMPYYNNSLGGQLVGGASQWDSNPHPYNANLRISVTPRSNWWRQETIGYHGYQSDGWYTSYINNHLVFTPQIDDTSTPGDPAAWWRSGHPGLDINTVAIGSSFFRYKYCPAGGSMGHNDAWMYFDDLYVDNTMSRVMLGNASTYTNCTILEPQIPSAWSTGEITVEVNLGALTGTTGYLYVFDSTNTCNSTGYTVTLDQEGEITTTSSSSTTTTAPVIVTTTTSSTSISTTTSVAVTTTSTTVAPSASGVTAQGVNLELGPGYE